MAAALRFYRDLLGFPVVGRDHPDWTVVDARGAHLTLYRSPESPRLALGPERDATPFTFHVASFPEAADKLEGEGFQVRRVDKRQGVVWDPFGNALGLHDHRT